ncbi:MAG TPA: ferredoxin [Planctomycetota bacterium]|nr:ferredoxin [Planctomycetota bacterium]
MSEIDPTRDPKQVRLSRRSFVTTVVRAGALVALGGGAAGLVVKKAGEKRTGDARFVWQIDPWKCTQCGQCATECVLDVSAVKCVHDFTLCGYCKLCTGFFPQDADIDKLDTGAEKQLCPAGAIMRKFVDEPYYEYTIDESLCIGCSRCVKGCTQYGNGSLYLQVRHDRCLNCNECAIAAACPSDAFVLRPVDDPYILKSKGRAPK